MRMLTELSIDVFPNTTLKKKMVTMIRLFMLNHLLTYDVSALPSNFERFRFQDFEEHLSEILCCTTPC